METINELIKKSDSNLNKLIKKAQAGKNLEPIFQGAIDPDLAKQCRFANYKKSILTVIVKNSSWATKLRFAIPDIIKNLKIYPEFKEITKIKYVIDIDEQPQIKSGKPNRLSEKNEKLLRETIAELKSRELKNNNLPNK